MVKLLSVFLQQSGQYKAYFLKLTNPFRNSSFVHAKRKVECNKQLFQSKIMHAQDDVKEESKNTVSRSKQKLLRCNP